MLTATIDGTRVRILFPRKRPESWAKGDMGECVRNRNGSFTIRVLATLSPIEKFITLMHELAHAIHWNHDERHVDQWTEDMAHILLQAKVVHL